MRLDKYLKVARIIKRRTVAHDATSKDKVLVNEKIAKPSTMVKIGDIVTINYFNRIVKIKILSTDENVRAKDANCMYELISDEIIENN